MDESTYQDVERWLEAELLVVSQTQVLRPEGRERITALIQAGRDGTES